MAINIRQPETERLAARVARLTGETKVQAIHRALEERLVRLRPVESPEALMKRIQPILDRFAKLPTLDDRSPDEIVGYDENGLPT